MEDFKGINLPIIDIPNLIKNFKPVLDQKLVQLYQSYIRISIWAYIYIRLDLGFSVSILNQFSSNLIPEYFDALKKIYRYL